MKKFILAVSLAAIAFTITSCGSSRRGGGWGTGCPNGVGARNL